MQIVDLDNLVRVDLVTNPAQADRADLKTLLVLSPAWAGEVKEFFSTAEVDADGGLGAADKARLRAALVQRGVASVKIGGAGASETAAQTLARLREEDDGWIAIAVSVIAAEDEVVTAPHVAHDYVDDLSDLLETAKEKLLVVDAWGMVDDDGDLVTDGDFSDLALLEGREFTTVFAIGPDLSVENPLPNYARQSHGIQVAALVLGLDADRRSAAWSWQQLEQSTPSVLPTPSFPANQTWLNVYGRNRGIDITARGVTTSGHPVHGTIAALWFKFRAGERITEAMARYTQVNGKIPYDNTGISLIAATVSGLLRDAERIGHALEGSTAMNAPAVDEISPSDYTNGHYPMRAGFRVQGSIVSVELQGIVSMTFEAAEIGLEG